MIRPVNRRQSRYQMDMCSGPLLRKIVIVAVPLILSGILQLLFNTTDLIVVGRFASYKALAAIGVTGAVVQLMINICLGMSVGTNVLVARYLGAQQRSHVSRTVHTAILFSLAGGVVMTISGICLTRPLLRLLNTPDNIMDMAALYLQIYFAGMPGSMLYNFGSSILRASGDTRRPFYFLVIGGVINVLLNLFFVLVCGWDVGGVATATIAAQALSGVLVLRVLVQSRNFCRVKLSNLKIHWSYLRDILWIGIPSSFQGACFALANLWIQTALNTYGAEILAASTTASAWDAIGFLLSTALGQTVVSFVSQNYGGKQYSRIWKSIKYASILCTCATFLYCFGIWIFLEEALALFNKNPEVIFWGKIKLHILLPLMFICNLQEIWISGLRGLGYSIGPTIMMIFCIAGLRLVWLFTIYSMFPSFQMLMLTYPFTWSAAALMSWIYLRYALKKLPGKDDVRISKI